MSCARLGTYLACCYPRVDVKLALYVVYVCRLFGHTLQCDVPRLVCRRRAPTSPSSFHRPSRQARQRTPTLRAKNPSTSVPFPHLAHFVEKFPCTCPPPPIAVPCRAPREREGAVM